MEGLSKIISAGVGPIIVISACGLLCLALYNRLAAVVTRLRAFHMQSMAEEQELTRQRRAPNPDEMAVVRHQEVLGMLRVQTEHVTRRARLIRSTIQCLLMSIASLALCSLCLGLSEVWPPMVYAAVVLFVGGLLLVVAAAMVAMVEMKQALDPIELEGRFVADMFEQFDDNPLHHAESPHGPDKKSVITS
jgi:hypothetical protein